MKFHSEPFVILKDGTARERVYDAVNEYPMFNESNGKRITNLFTYMAVMVLRRAIWEVANKEFAPGVEAHIHISVAHEKEDYWIEAEVD